MWRTRKTAGALATATLATAALAAPPAAATASQELARCKVDNYHQCATKFPTDGRTLRVDADVVGSGPVRFHIYDAFNTQHCPQDFSAEEPPRTWHCSMPAGTQHAIITAAQGRASHVTFTISGA